MIKRYFNINLSVVGRRLTEHIEGIMLRNLWGMITKGEWEELHSGVAKISNTTKEELMWGGEILGYYCANCGGPFYNTWGYGPGCFYDPSKTTGCGNIAESYRSRVWQSAEKIPGEVLDLAKDVLEIMRDMHTAAIEKAAAVVKIATIVPGTFIKTAKRGRKRIEDFLG